MLCARVLSTFFVPFLIEMVQGNSYNKFYFDNNLINRKLALVLKCYVLLDMVEDIQNYYRENFVVPFIDTIITRVFSCMHIHI